jgi:hypothetical protein
MTQYRYLGGKISEFEAIGGGIPAVEGFESSLRGRLGAPGGGWPVKKKNT